MPRDRAGGSTSPSSLSMPMIAGVRRAPPRQPPLIAICPASRPGAPSGRGGSRRWRSPATRSRSRMRKAPTGCRSARARAPRAAPTQDGAVHARAVAPVPPANASNSTINAASQGCPLWSDHITRNTAAVWIASASPSATSTAPCAMQRSQNFARSGPAVVQALLQVRRPQQHAGRRAARSRAAPNPPRARRWLGWQGSGACQMPADADHFAASSRVIVYCPPTFSAVNLTLSPGWSLAIRRRIGDLEHHRHRGHVEVLDLVVLHA